MAGSKPTNITEYLASIPPERRKELSAVRQVVKRNLPKGYKEVLRWGIISWEIPLTHYPRTHNAQPLCYAALGAQKNHLSLYLMGCYMVPAQAAAIKTAFQEEGKRLDMGKSCIRFKRAADLPLGAIGRSVAAVPPGLYILRYEEVLK